MNKYDVIIIGAGPSGIFCAYELMRQKPDMKVLMIEKGRSIEKRQCPKRTTKVCVGCKPCSITTGFAGAGAFSDGKYNITNDFGGTLYEHIGKSQAIELMKYVDVLVDGEFEVDKKDATLHWKGSSNQKVIDVQKTLEKGEIVLHEEDC